MFLLKSKLNKKVRALQNVGIVKINDAENYANELKKYDIYDDIILSGAKFYNAHLHLVDDFYYGLIYCFTDNSVILDGYFNNMFIQLKDNARIENGTFGRVIVNDSAIINNGEFNITVELYDSESAKINSGVFNNDVKIFHSSAICGGEFNGEVYVHHPASLIGGKFNDIIYYIGLNDELKNNKEMMKFIKKDLAKYWCKIVGEDFDATSENYSSLMI
jgi:hypothetical protein